MAETKRYYWLRLYDDFFSSKRIKKLRKLAGGDTFTIIYLKMQLKALKSGGRLEYNGIEDSFEEELALDIDEDADNVKLTVAYLMSVGLLEESSVDEYYMPFVAECTGSETASAQRVRKHRQNAKALQSNTEEATLLQDCSAEKEIEKDTKDRDIEENCSAFNAEKAWSDTFAIYPKKRGAGPAKVAWMNMIIDVLPENRKDVAMLIYSATRAYIESYTTEHPDDLHFRYVPKYEEWLEDDCGYWISVVEGREKPC